MNLTAGPLDRALLRYQTAVLEKNFELANAVLPEIGTRELEKLSLFLQSQGFLEEAMNVTRDPMRKLDLAISMKHEKTAIQILEEIRGDGPEIAKYWSQIAEICMDKGDIATALVSPRESPHA